MIATIVETKELLQTVAASLVAGDRRHLRLLGRDLGRGQFADLSRGERPVAATAAAVVGALALLCVAAARSSSASS